MKSDNDDMVVQEGSQNCDVNGVTRNANRPHFFRTLEHACPDKSVVQMNRSEDLGTGIRNVYKYFKPYAGTVPVFKEEDLFVVEVPLGEGEAVKKTVKKLDEKILELIKTTPEITIGHLQTQLNLTKRKVEWQINKLKRRGLLKRTGLIRPDFRR